MSPVLPADGEIRPRDLVTMMIEAARELDAAQAELIACTRSHAEAERKSKRAKAIAYLASSGTVAEREAHVNRACEEEMYAAHLAEGLARSALEATRNRRQVLSSLQSIATAVREEAALARTGPA